MWLGGGWFGVLGVEESRHPQSFQRGCEIPCEVGGYESRGCGHGDPRFVHLRCASAAQRDLNKLIAVRLERLDVFFEAFR